MYDDSYIDSFTSWINANQDIEISGERVAKLLDVAGKYDEEEIEESIEKIAAEFSESQASDVLEEPDGVWAQDVKEVPTGAAEEAIMETTGECAVGEA